MIDQHLPQHDLSFKITNNKPPQKSEPIFQFQAYDNKRKKKF